MAARPPSPPPPAAQPLAKAPKVDPYKQQPSFRNAEHTSAAEFIQVVCLSRKDRRFLDAINLYGGLSVKLKGTDHDPDRADLEFSVGNRKIGRFKKLTDDDVVSLVGLNGTPYEVVVMSVDDGTKTVQLGLRPARQ